MALDGPQFVTRLILLDSAGLKASREGGAFKEVLSDPTEASLKSFYQKAYFQPKDLPGYYWREIVQKARALSAQHGVLGRAGAHGKADEDLDLRFASLQQLVFLLWGKQDRVIPIEIGYQMRELVKRNAIWREVDGCGHFPQKECPDVVVQSIIDVIHFGLI
jgi:pimeloyl-ACP methyl ester carboxylesterase